MLKHVVSPETRGAIDYWTWRTGLRRLHHLSQPFNGQVERTRIVHDILQSLEFGCIVETGTYRGTTTEYLARQFGLPVHTVEANPRFHAFARRRLGDRPSIHPVHADSRTFLRRLAANSARTRTPTFFYLDAHWEQDLPLREELEIIRAAWNDAAIVVDDFAVPGDSGYGYDDYGRDAVLELDLIRPLLDGTYAAFFPAAPSSAESGHRRGCVVLGLGAAVPALRGLSSLRSLDAPVRRAAA